MAEAPQSYKSHAKFVPMFHFVLLPLALLNLLFMIYRVWLDPTVLSAWGVVMAFAFIVVSLFARVFALKAQDRLIRLEERLRLRELLPADLQSRIREFSTDQLIALRFASDAELPGLAATVLRDNLVKRDAIKKLIKNWRTDDFRV